MSLEHLSQPDVPKEYSNNAVVAEDPIRASPSDNHDAPPNKDSTNAFKGCAAGCLIFVGLFGLLFLIMCGKHLLYQ